MAHCLKNHGWGLLALALWSLAPSLCRSEDIVFRRHVLNAESTFLAAAVDDVNRDGKLDIVCGSHWYEGPTWKTHFLRNVEFIGGRYDGYAHLPLDVNGDGWNDLITVNFPSRSIKWIEHPGAQLRAGVEWKAHVVAQPGSMETGRLVDVDGDGKLDLLPNGAAFAAWWELVKKPDPTGKATTSWVRHDLPRELAGHGLGFGDVNGDGRGDVIGRNGWAEAPTDPRKGRWIWHPEFDLDQASVPILIVDVNGDGLNDLVWTKAHNYGAYWMEQVRTKEGRKWVKHVIDTSWSGAHTPLWEDLDGDSRKELILGKRYFAHMGSDPGEYDPQAAYRYQFDPKMRTWQRWAISENEGIGFGLDPKVADLDGDGDLDLVCGGRNGLYWLENLGKPRSAGGTAERIPLRYPSYTDHRNLLVLKDETGKERPVKTPFDWGRRRAHILAAAERVLGPLPDSSARVPLDVRVVSETPTESYLRQKITYASDPEGRVSAYLLIPNKVRKAAPALLCLHDATPLGKDEPAGLGGKVSLHFAHELAQRGYVCLVPDYPSFGESKHDFKNNRYASGSMKAVWDNIRGIDLLEAMPEVNSNRIGCIGHGQGGQSALFTAAFDYRLAAVVSSCGFTSFTHYQGGNLTDWAAERYLPRIRDVYKNDPAKVPFDFGELIATLVPRSLFVSAPLHDTRMDVEGVKSALASAGSVYHFRKVSGSLRIVHPDAGREFPDAVRTEAYAWLDRALKR